MTPRAPCHGWPPTQEILQFDTIIDVRVAAVRATQTSWRSRHERFNCTRAYELRTIRS